MFGFKWAAIGAAIIAGLLVIWRIIVKFESAGAAKEKVRQDREAKKAKTKMDEVKNPETENETWDRADRGEL